MKCFTRVAINTSFSLIIVRAKCGVGDQIIRRIVSGSWTNKLQTALAASILILYVIVEDSIHPSPGVGLTIPAHNYN